MNSHVLDGMIFAHCCRQECKDAGGWLVKFYSKAFSKDSCFNHLHTWLSKRLLVRILLMPAHIYFTQRLIRDWWLSSRRDYILYYYLIKGLMTLVVIFRLWSCTIFYVYRELISHCRQRFPRRRLLIVEWIVSRKLHSHVGSVGSGMCHDRFETLRALILSGGSKSETERINYEEELFQPDEPFLQLREC